MLSNIESILFIYIRAFPLYAIMNVTVVKLFDFWNFGEYY